MRFYMIETYNGYSEKVYTEMTDFIRYLMIQHDAKDIETTEGAFNGILGGFLKCNCERPKTLDEYTVKTRTERASQVKRVVETYRMIPVGEILRENVTTIKERNGKEITLKYRAIEREGAIYTIVEGRNGLTPIVPFNRIKEIVVKKCENEKK